MNEQDHRFHGTIKIADTRLRGALKDTYNENDGRLYFERPSQKAYEKALGADINRIKMFLRRWPALFEFLRFFSPGISGYPLTARRAIKRTFTDEEMRQNLVVNIGSGTRNVHEEAFNLDIYPMQNVHLVADAVRLPFKDASVDMVICDAVLEHVAEKNAVVREISRVVKSGGFVYVVVPFLYPFNEAPADYYRWVKTGIANDFNDFETVSLGIYAGPAAALQGLLMHFFAIPLSLGNNKLYIFWHNLFRFLFSPLKLLDFVLTLFPHAHEASAMLYFYGRKK